MTTEKANISQPGDHARRSAFFYGTLMAPQVLHRVCHGSMSPSNAIYAASPLVTAPAVLPAYQRHRVRGADYPAILPRAGSSVRGTYVTGLSDADVWRLDIFEGSEYSRQKVTVQLLARDVENHPVGTEARAGAEEVEAETYVWTANPDELEEAEWDFDEFRRDKMRFWVGSEGEGEYAGRPSIIEVDEAVAAAERQNDGTRGRGVDGHITKALQEDRQKQDL